MVVDLQALQSPSYRGRGIGRYALEWATAVERVRPELVHSYLLNPHAAPPGDLGGLVATGKVRYAGASGSLGTSARILHLLAPLDTTVPVAQLWPASAGQAGLVVSATVYDLIPALDPDLYLTDFVERSRYRVRLELLRAAAQVHVLSRSVGTDLGRIVGVAETKIVVTGAAPAHDLVPVLDRGAAQARATRAISGLARNFVLYPTGSHPRKNNERLVEAWALLPRELTATHQLVLAGDLPASTAHHLVELAARLGTPHSVVTTGYIDDSVLRDLYRAADLVCFPSLAEGFGLPVVEAMACATPVVVSDRPPLDELVESSSRFDPEDPADIARSMARALRQPGAPEGVGAVARLSTWDDVARRATSAFDELLELARPDRPGRQRDRRGTSPAASTRPRYAFVSPLPPAPTGVAAYSYRLLEAMAAQDDATIDAFTDGPTTGQVAPDGVEIFGASALELVELARGGYDAVVYTLGNSHHHVGALEMLRRRRGTVVGHDVRLTNLYRHLHGDPGLRPGGFARALRAMYGGRLPAHLGADGSVSTADVDLYGLLMAREAIARSNRFLVTSHAAARLAAIDAGPALAGKIGVLEFAVARPDVTATMPFAAHDTRPPDGLARALRAGWGQDASLAAGRFVVAHFGIVDASKRPDLLLEAHSLAGASLAGSILAFVGPVSQDLAHSIASQAAELGIAERVVLTGPLGGASYASWLGAARIAVQLRRSSNGEASAAAGECMACGIATLVTDVSWAAELPDDAVVKVPISVDASHLAHLLGELAGDPARREAVGAAARREAGRRSFEAAAVALLDLVRVT